MAARDIRVTVIGVKHRRHAVKVMVDDDASRNIKLWRDEELGEFRGAQQRGGRAPLIHAGDAVRERHDLESDDLVG